MFESFCFNKIVDKASSSRDIPELSLNKEKIVKCIKENIYIIKKEWAGTWQMIDNSEHTALAQFNTRIDLNAQCVSMFFSVLTRTMFYVLM